MSCNGGLYAKPPLHLHCFYSSVFSVSVSVSAPLSLGGHFDAVGVLDDGLIVLVAGRDGHSLLARCVAHALLNLDVAARL